MKKIFNIIILIIAFSLLSGCSNSEIRSEKNEILTISEVNGITTTIDLLTKTSATVIISDLTENNNIYWAEYIIEKYEDNEWIRLEEKEGLYSADSAIHRVNEDGILKLNYNWKNRYGELEKGKYRIINTFTSKTSLGFEDNKIYIATEFIIN